MYEKQVLYISLTNTSELVRGHKKLAELLIVGETVMKSTFTFSCQAMGTKSALEDRGTSSSVP